MGRPSRGAAGIADPPPPLGQPPQYGLVMPDATEQQDSGIAGYKNGFDHCMPNEQNTG